MRSQQKFTAAARAGVGKARSRCLREYVIAKPLRRRTPEFLMCAVYYFCHSLPAGKSLKSYRIPSAKIVLPLNRCNSVTCKNAHGAKPILRGNYYLRHRVKMRQLRRPLNVYDERLCPAE